MASDATISRRTALAAPSAMLLASGGTACVAKAQAPARSASRTLVVVFTRTGNTRVIAGMEADQERRTLNQVTDWLSAIEPS